MINIIETKDLSKKELINYFNNINNYPSISENERERLIEVVEKKMRVNFPNTAKKWSNRDKFGRVKKSKK